MPYNQEALDILQQQLTSDDEQTRIKARFMATDVSSTISDFISSEVQRGTPYLTMLGIVHYCLVAQIGWFIGKPLPPEDVDRIGGKVMEKFSAISNHTMLDAMRAAANTD